MSDDDGLKFTPGPRELLILLVVLAVAYIWVLPRFFP
jgi:hypothetical protein